MLCAQVVGELCTVLPQIQPITSGLHLIFNRHQTRYALPLSSVKEVICLPELVPIENMPDHIVGVFNYHGQLVPVMNLDSPLGHVSFRYKISDNVILFEWDGVISWIDCR